MKNITENNKIIAEFMGMSYYEKFLFEGWYKNNEHNQRVCNYEDLKYNSSWDWIIPVIEKIESIGACVIIGRFFCEIKYSDPLNDSIYFDNRMASGLKINAINAAALNFILWSNKNL